MPYKQTKHRSSGTILKVGQELCGKIHESNRAHSSLVAQVVTNMGDIRGLLDKIEALEKKIEDVEEDEPTEREMLKAESRMLFM